MARKGEKLRTFEEITGTSPKFRDELSQEERRYLSVVHRWGRGCYRVGASSIFIRRHPEGDWGVYAQVLEGEARVPGAWCFKKFRDARARGIAVAKELGHWG